MKLNRFVSKLKKMHCIIFTNGGFTLIEAIATIAIAGIVITPIAVVFQSSLQASIEARSQLKANQLAQQYIEIVEAMEYAELKDLVDSYGGVIDGTTISSGGYNIPEPLDGYNVEVDLHYGATRSDGTTSDSEYNTIFDTVEYVLDPSIINAPLRDYNILIHLESDDDSGATLYDHVNQYSEGATVNAGTFNATATNRNIEISFDYKDSSEVRTVATVRQGGESETQEFNTFVPGATPSDPDTGYLNSIVILCEDDIDAGAAAITTNITVSSTVDEDVDIYIYEPIDDVIRPNVIVNYGTVIITRGLAVVDKSVNTHRIYEIEVTITDSSGDELAHITSTRLAK